MRSVDRGRDCRASWALLPPGLAVFDFETGFSVLRLSGFPALRRANAIPRSGEKASNGRRSHEACGATRLSWPRLLQPVEPFDDRTDHIDGYRKDDRVGLVAGD